MRSKGNHIRIYPPGEHPEITRLDANKLGRPYHKVPKIFNDKFDLLDSKLSIYFLRKFRVNVNLTQFDFHMDSAIKQSTVFSSQLGNLGFRVDRRMLLDILQDYYGLARLHFDEAPPQSIITKTEERLLNKLASEMLTLLCCPELFSSQLELKPDYSTLITQWACQIDFTIDGYRNGTFSLLLDNAHVDRLLATLRQSSLSIPSNEVTTVPQQVNFRTLPIRLTGKLATLQLTVADIVKLKSGDVIPIAMAERVPLSIGSHQLFTAAIREDRGSLFLSEFADKTSQ